jgi:hypothetical protein
MARIRSVKPELRTSLTASEWPREVRYAWVLLWGYLDDYGRGIDDMRLVVADLFPLDRDVTERKMDGWLVRMTNSGVLCRYESAGRRYLHAVSWKDHQRISHPTDSRIPPCPVHDKPESDSARIPEPLPSDSGTAPSLFRSSRVPAEQGAGSKEQGELPAPEKTGAEKHRPQDPVWDAVIEVCSIKPSEITPTSRGAINKAVAELKAVDATAAKIRVRARRWSTVFPDAKLTPMALAKHYPQLDPAAANGKRDESWKKFADE